MTQKKYPHSTTRKIAKENLPGYQTSEEAIEFLQQAATRLVRELATTAARIADQGGRKMITAHHVRLAQERQNAR